MIPEVYGVGADVDLEWFEELLKDCMLIFGNALCVCTRRLDNDL